MRVLEQTPYIYLSIMFYHVKYVCIYIYTVPTGADPRPWIHATTAYLDSYGISWLARRCAAQSFSYSFASRGHSSLQPWMLRSIESRGRRQQYVATWTCQSKCLHGLQHTIFIWRPQKCSRALSDDARSIQFFAPAPTTFMRRAVLFTAENAHSARLAPATNLKSRCVSCKGFALQLPRLLAFSQDWVLRFKEDFLTRATGVKIRLLWATPGRCAFPADRAAPSQARAPSPQSIVRLPKACFTVPDTSSRVSGPQALLVCLSANPRTAHLRANLPTTTKMRPKLVLLLEAADGPLRFLPHIREESISTSSPHIASCPPQLSQSKPNIAGDEDTVTSLCASLHPTIAPRFEENELPGHCWPCYQSNSSHAAAPYNLDHNRPQLYEREAWMLLLHLSLDTEHCNPSLGTGNQFCTS